MTYARMAAAMCVISILALPLLLFPGLLGLGDFDRASGGLSSSVLALISIVTGAAFFFFSHLLMPPVERLFQRFIDASDAPLRAWVKEAPQNAVLAAIVVLSGLSLFLELVLIRWQGSLFPVFALYKNFTLLACFCGLGIGYALSHKRPLLIGAALPLLALTLAALTALRYTKLPHVQDLLFLVPVHEETSVFTGTVASDPVTWVFFNLPVYLLLVAAFVMNTLVMIPVTQFCGHVMTRVDALKGYGCNLLGSIAGVVLLFVLSWLWMGPVVWFGISAAMLVWYLLPARAAARVGACAAAVCVLVAAWPAEPMVQSIYSPYQLIQKTAKKDGYMEILSAGSYYQGVYDLSLSNLNRNHAGLKKVVGYYELPYRTAESLKRVVIVGAGSGNDAAAALRAGAKSVDAVEIDPAILALGRANHPEHPYDDRRVNAITDDARTFFRNSKDTYDAVVYSVLDSHILLSHGSNVRLDSFVYTQEGLREAYARLKKGGLLSVSFTLSNDLMGRKIYRILSELPDAGRPVAIYCGDEKMMNTTAFLLRKGEEIKPPLKFMADHGLIDRTVAFAGKPKETLDLPTDDWPFFYMDKRMYPGSYVVALVLVMALAVLLVRMLLPDQKWNKSLLPFFFLGGGFMLVETKAITELGLLFGNTWHVIGITIIGVLIMAFCANVLVAKYEFRKVIVPYVLLLSAVVVGYIIAIYGGFGNAGFLSKLGMIVLLTSPMLFSGIVFSALLKNADDLPSALAYNLMGAMLGGLLEYNSMQFGFAFLYLLAFALYAAAALTTQKKLLGLK